MASKYLSIEETIELLGIPQEEITRLREAGDLRGFADRGTWKFRAEDVEEFSRSRQADSSDNVGLGDDELSLDDDDFESLGTASLLDEDDEVSADQPTLIQQTTDDEPLLSLDDTSDSDVRLVID
ncbi:MAG: helix-turn-helix domain-containing protein, partial [Planctomycetota bacterium]|nr:helix-turn-helix domain-containing protein [Planctomycetota bacterium]